MEAEIDIVTVVNKCKRHAVSADSNQSWSSEDFPYEVAGFIMMALES